MKTTKTYEVIGNGQYHTTKSLKDAKVLLGTLGQGGTLWVVQAGTAELLKKN